MGEDGYAFDWLDDGRVETVICGDCREYMRHSMAGETVDAIVTDPPYGLGFMGADWDSYGGRNGTETVAERREKGNAYDGDSAVVPRFAGSHGKRPKLDEMREFQRSMAEVWREALLVSKPGAHLLCFGGTRTFHRMACAIEEAGWVVKDCIMWVYGSGMPHGQRVDRLMEGKYLGLAPEWEGWNTQLKPAWEPIIVAYKPFAGGVARCAAENGTGALNIGACRVPTDPGDNVFAKNPHTRSKGKESGIYGAYGAAAEDWSGDAGRYPSNLAHDGSEDVTGLFPMQGSQSTARFYYCAKASKRERGEANLHPTVKPLALMEWLVKMVSREDSLVLDPFAGSGTTLVACKRLGREFVGIEREPEYCEVIRSRLGEVVSDG